VTAEKQSADAEYIAGRCRELIELADYSGFEFGAYLLRVAEQEFAKHQRGSRSRTESQGPDKVSA
jgi:hypothetical protein